VVYLQEKFDDGVSAVVCTTIFHLFTLLVVHLSSMALQADEEGLEGGAELCAGSGDTCCGGCRGW
jgi:hypothetical protein